MNSREYFRYLQETILAAPHVIQSNLSFDEVSNLECYVRGFLVLTGGFELHMAEYVVSHPQVTHLKYRYHLQTSDKRFIARWDNATHHPNVDSHPNHLHLADGSVNSSPVMDIEKVLRVVVYYLYQED